MTQPDKWIEIAAKELQYHDADASYLRLAVADALRSAYAEGKKAGMNDAAVLTVEQAKVFRNEAHDQKQWGNREMHKRALAIASCFDSHASAIAVRAAKETKNPPSPS